MGLVNHLKQIDARNAFRVISYGEHIANGTLGKSIVSGEKPTHLIKLQQFLGQGEWEGISRGIYWNNLAIPSADYAFYPGSQTQGVDSVFSSDNAHLGTAWIRANLPTGVGEFDTKASPPFGLQAYCKTKKVNDYNAAGVAVNFSYSANAARQIADLILKQGGRPSSIIDWGAWLDWRACLDELLMNDYRTLANFDGFGLTATYYSGTNFNTFHSKRIDALVSFLSAGLVPGFGLSPTSFSVKFEGYIKLKYNETYTFYLSHNNGGRMTVNGSTVIVNEFLTDGTTVAGTHSGTASGTANTFLPVLIEWNRGNAVGASEIKLEWQSTSQPRQVVPSKYLYPKEEMRPRYETHPFFSTRTRLDDAVRTVLNLCNSTYQKVNGKYRFFCLDQITSSSFDFTEDHILSITPHPRKKANLRNRWTAVFRDIDSRFLETTRAPFIIQRPDLITLAGRPIEGDDIEFFNCSRFQAYRLLSAIVAREVDSVPLELIGNASTFPVLSGDKVTVTSEVYDYNAKEFFVNRSNDASSEETADERNFSLTSWVS